MDPAADSLQDRSLRVLLMGGVETRFHRFDEVGPVLAKMLVEASHQVRSLVAPDALKPEILRQFDAIVSITTGGILSGAQESALFSAVSEGRNDADRPVHFLGLHGASCSFENSRRYFEMLGGRFIRHLPMARFEVEIENPSHPVAGNVDKFEIYDELYLLDVKSEVELLLSAARPAEGLGRSTSETLRSGERRVPLGWARRYGSGKVCYLALGHGPEQLRHPALVQLIRQSLVWFADDNDVLRRAAPARL